MECVNKKSILKAQLTDKGLESFAALYMVSSEFWIGTREGGPSRSPSLGGEKWTVGGE